MISYGFCFGDIVECECDVLFVWMVGFGVVIVMIVLVVVLVLLVVVCCVVGVIVIGGNDGVCDMWMLYGLFDMFECVMLIGMCNDFCCDDVFEVVFDCVMYGVVCGCGFVDYGL